MPRHFVVIIAIIAITTILSACSISGDSDDPDPSPTEVADIAPTATDAPDVPTATTEPTATATATTTPTSTATPEPTATATATPSPTPTATPIPIVQNPFADAPSPDLVLENYTITYFGEFDTENTDPETLDLFVEQSSPAHYHLRAGTEVELWVIEDATYFRNPEDGSVFQIPSAVDPGLISPAAYLIQVPNPANVPQALEVGTDEVEGRPATHYSVSGDLIALFNQAEDQTVNDPEGEINVWIDQELGFVSKMDVDMEWTDETGVRQSAIIDLVVSMVGTTAEISAPV